MSYAESTTVPAERSRVEIEKTLRRYGADGFMSGYDRNQAFLGFIMGGRQVKIFFPLPDPDDLKFNKTPTGKARATEPARKAWEQETRRMWRAANLVIKAKLEAIESGISTFDQEFLAHLVLPNGTTVGQTILPQLDQITETGQLPRLLPGPEGESNHE